LEIGHIEKIGRDWGYIIVYCPHILQRKPESMEKEMKFEAVRCLSQIE
jgi:hypothetical protein